MEEDNNMINVQIKNDAERFQVDLEQPVLLRLPEEEADILREQIQKGEVKLTIQIPEGKNSGICLFNDREYCATIVQLPCIVETHKSYDDVSLYKTGDIGQAIIIHTKDNEPRVDETGRLKSGITPPTNRIVNKYSKQPTEEEKNEMKKTCNDIHSIITSNRVDDDD